MDNTREKLIETLGDFPLYPSIMRKAWMPQAVENLADHLIENGVTVQKWIPVTERLPVEESKAFELELKEYPMYIVMIDMAFLPATLYYDWQNDVWFDFRHDGKIDEYDVTHWMPLPEPPKEE